MGQRGVFVHPHFDDGVSQILAAACVFLHQLELCAPLEHHQEAGQGASGLGPLLFREEDHVQGCLYAHIFRHEDEGPIREAGVVEVAEDIARLRCGERAEACGGFRGRGQPEHADAWRQG